MPVSFSPDKVLTAALTLCRFEMASSKRNDACCLRHPQVTLEQRSHAKAMVYGLLYGKVR
jgi:hypothetical protein